MQSPNQTAAQAAKTRLARDFLLRLSSAAVTLEQLRPLEMDCRQRWAQAYKALRHAQSLAPGKVDRDAALMRAQAHQELAVLVPALRRIRAMKQQLRQGQAVRAHVLAARLVSAAARLPLRSLLAAAAPEFQNGQDQRKAALSVQCTTPRQTELAAALLAAHPQLFCELPAQLAAGLPGGGSEVSPQGELAVRKAKLFKKIIRCVPLDLAEQELLRKALR